jgi:hypothetical protein
MTNTIQKHYKVSSTQLLYQSCPYQAVTLFIIGPFLDAALTKRNVFAFNYNSYILVSVPCHILSERPCYIRFELQSRLISEVFWNIIVHLIA